MPADHPRQRAAVSAASIEEAAAIAAALDRFLHETIPSQASDSERQDPWTRAAMLEGVSREDHVDVPHPWINT